MTKYILTLLSCLFVNVVFSQTTIEGTVTDKDGNILIGANIVLVQKGAFKAGASTDFDGYYTIKVDSGVYDVEASYIGYARNLKKGIIIKDETKNIYNATMEDAKSSSHCCGWLISYKIPVYQRSEPNTMNAITAEQVRRAPIKKVKEFVGMVPGVSVGF